MSYVNQIAELGHEQVSVFQDPASGLTSIIALHNTVLGPAIGGCRMRPYSNLEEALHDVLLLSEGMTYKNSLCGLNIGGGKSVIVADPALQDGREELFEAFGRCVESFKGKYYTAEDMGTSVEDINAVQRSTKFVVGSDPAKGGGGDPSPYTARGVFDGMRACLERARNSGDYAGVRVAIQGVGHVGFYLAQHLHEAGAKLIVSDTNTEALERAKNEFGAEIVEPDAIYAADCDVFAPCAIGGTVNTETVPLMSCSIIAGAANNQIADERTVGLIQGKNILYAPDFAINSGGVILCSDELEEGGFTQSRVDRRVGRIYDTVANILDMATKEHAFSGDIAVRLARERIEEAR